jgi:hypothetical protein
MDYADRNWTRTSYDKSQYNNQLMSSEKASNFVLDKSSVENKKCIGTGTGLYKTNSTPSTYINVESALKGLEKQNPKEVFTFIDNCTTNFDESTRLTNGPCTLRGTGINRFSPIATDPQKHLSNPYEIGLNVREKYRSTYKPCIPKVINYSNTLPQGNYDNNNHNPDYASIRNLTSTTSLDYTTY